MFKRIYNSFGRCSGAARRLFLLPLASVVSLAALAGGVTFVAGCGGGGGGGASGTASPSSGYANRSYSATNLAESGIGTGSLTLNVSGDSQTVRGTYALTFSSSSETAAVKAVRIVPLPSPTAAATNATTAANTKAQTVKGTFTGVLDPTTGAFSISGSYTDDIGDIVPFTLTGTLPPPPATTGGTLIINVDTLIAYQTSFGVSPAVTILQSTNPTPTPTPVPIPTPTPTPTPGTALYTAVDVGDPGAGYALNYVSFGAGGGGQGAGGGGQEGAGATMNANGQIASSWSDASLLPHAFLYTPGSGFQDLGRLSSGYNGAYANGINDSGVVVGSSENNPSFYAALFSGGSVQNLGSLYTGPLTTVYNYAAAINDSGQVAGTSETNNFTQHAFLDTNGLFQDLGTLGGKATYDLSYATALNAAGQVVGSSYTSSDASHAFLYSNGVMQDLGTLTQNSVANSGATSINASGQVAGYSSDNSGSVHSFLYTNGAMQNLDTLSGVTTYASYASSINDSGQIIGYAEYPGTEEVGAYIYSNGVLQNLNDITAGLGGLTLYYANTITNSGLILAEGASSSGVYHLVVLTPLSSETRARHPILVGKRARGVSKDRLPRWMRQGPPFTHTLPKRLRAPQSE